MSIDIVREQIEKFIKSQESSVLALRGHWGVGKTYFWKSLFDGLKKKGQVGLEKYAYVSVFGVNSIDELKLEIYTKVEDLQESTFDPPNLLDTTKRHASFVKKKIAPYLGGVKLPYIDVSEAIKTFGYRSLNEVLICIDDIERKGKNLHLKDVMGLISVLKEEKSCRIIIIFNDKKIEGEDEGKYKDYREKVIDIDLEFNRTSAECIDIAIKEDTEYHKKIKKLISLLAIKNIRIIKKIEAVATELVELLEPHNFEPEVQHQTLHTISLFTWCFYGGAMGAPSIEYAKKYNSGYNASSSDDEESTEHKKWNSILNNYGFGTVDEIDLEIIQTIKRGFVDQDEFIKLADALNEKKKASKLEGSFTSAWSLYHDTFEDNEEDVVKEISESFKNGAEHISPLNLNGTVTLFRELGHDDKANELIAFYIEARKETNKLFDLDSYPFTDDISDPIIISKFKEHYENNIEEKSLEDALSEMIISNGWSIEDEIILSKASADDYYQLFKSTKGKNFHKYIRKCVEFGSFTPLSDRHKIIYENTVEALTRISEESTLNKRRVSKFIKLPPSPKKDPE